MKRLALTSPGVLLILAVASASGVVLLDATYLKPYLDRRKAEAAGQDAFEAGNALRSALRREEESLLRLCRAWAADGRARRGGGDEGLPGAGQPADAPGPGGGLLASDAADLAWLQEPDGKVAWVHSKEGTRAPPPGKVARALSQLPPGFVRGIVRLDATPVVAARCDIADGGRPAGSLWLARHFAGAVLADLNAALGGRNLCLVAPSAAPVGLREDPSGWFGVRLAEKETGFIESAWLLRDATGAEAGYLKADLPTPLTFPIAADIRKTVLAILSASAALLLLVAFGMQVLVSQPVRRVLRRLREIEGGRSAARELSETLRTEPFLLAERLESAFDKLTHISKTDELTALANRRHFEEVLDYFYRQARRYDRPLAVMVMDVDFFKAVNDAAGHSAGDDFLRRMARAIEQECRSADLPARLGGDEFAVLLPETTSDDAAAVAERIRQAVAEQTMTARSVEVKATVSIGIADLAAGEITSGQTMVALADEALYRAKEHGRNQVVQAGEFDSVAWRQKDDVGLSKVSVLYSKLAGLDTQFQDLFLCAVEEIVEMLERRDPHMADHARKVQRCSVAVAREMELPERVVKRIATAAMLHDIGMLAMPDSVLLCPGQLDGAQLRLVQRHPLLGVEMMQRMEFLEQEIPAVRYHHERYDGTGYPEGLRGAEIPLSARILAVGDSFVAITSPRAYRAAMTWEEAVEEIRAGAGTQFDPGVVAAFETVVQRLGQGVIHIRPGEGGGLSKYEPNRPAAWSPGKTTANAPLATPDKDPGDCPAEAEPLPSREEPDEES